MEIDNIFPLVVPSDYYREGTWDLPHYKLPNHSIILTWVIFGSTNSMTYISQEEYQLLESKYKNWQQKALDNLRIWHNGSEYFFTHYKLSEDRQKLQWLCFMNDDGIGSSRLLLSEELAKGFPNGYYLSFPDRSIGIAVSKEMTEVELNETVNQIVDMYEKATTQMSNQLHLPSDFALPSSWTQPIDQNLSDTLVKQILSLSEQTI